MSWQPIDTAPKKSEPKIDVWVEELTHIKPRYYRVANVYWDADGVVKTFDGGRWAIAPQDRFFKGLVNVESPSIRIAHWMPIPSGPAD